jgi:site-specific recombinase XerD
MNIQELADTVYLRHYQETKSAYKTKIVLDDIVNTIGSKKNIKNINAETIDKLINSYKKRDNTNSTINRKLAILSKLMSYAHEREYITQQPKIKLLKVENHKILYFNEEDEQKLLQYFEHKHRVMYYFCIIGFKTGMRLSETLDIEADWIEDGYIRLYNNKGNHPRSIPMTEEVKKVIEAIQPDMFKYSLNNQKANHWFKKAVKELELNSGYTIHTMRHTFCSRLVQKGVELHIIQKFAGHKDARMTQRYAHLSNKNLEDAIKLL